MLPATVKEIMVQSRKLIVYWVTTYIDNIFIILKDTWTLQMGYPLITVVRDYAAGTAQVTQVCSHGHVNKQ